MLEQFFDLSGKVAAVTGAGGVLCSAMASAFGEVGAKVAVLERDIARGEAVADSIRRRGGTAEAIPLDVLKRDQIAAAIETVENSLGPVDILVNGAGGNKKEATTSPDLSFFDIPEEAIQFVFELNLLGALLPSQVFGKRMAERKEGVIINISSMNAFRPLTRIPAYSAAKAALSNFTQWLATHMAKEYSPRIRVNAIAPGFFLTEQNRFLLTSPEDGSLTARGKTIIDHTPAGRFGSPEDLLATVLWLASPGASFVTGIVVPVDGGFSAFSGV